MSPRARQAKGKARLTRYEELVAEAAVGREAGRPPRDRDPLHRRLGDKVIIAHDVEKGYGDRLLIEDLSFSLPPAGIIGVVGPNGAGKTTLFRMITGGEAA